MFCIEKYFKLKWIKFPAEKYTLHELITIYKIWERIHWRIRKT